MVYYLTHTHIFQSKINVDCDMIKDCVILKTRNVSNIISIEALGLNDSGSTTNILRILCQDSIV
jgi:hypothetical protein